LGQAGLEGLRRRALEVAWRAGEEERRLVKDLIESSHRMVYLGYVPALYRHYAGAGPRGSLHDGRQ